jgi:ferredoxin
MKFDEMADFVIDRGLAKEISKDEAMDIIKLSQENNLVHFVDNAIGDVKHNCNCCGHSCWSVARIRKRKIPRDVIMATYFIRETDEEACTGCGECIEVCPVDALKLEDGIAKVDEEWCIGCGVCISKCAFNACRMIVRPDKKDEIPASSFEKLHEQILEEKGLR